MYNVMQVRSRVTTLRKSPYYDLFGNPNDFETLSFDPLMSNN